MKRTIAGMSGLVILLVIGVMAILFFYARSFLTDEYEAANAAVQQEEDIQHVENIHHYFGEEAVYTLEAVNTSGEEEWIFYHEGEVIERIPKQETLTAGEAKDLVNNRFQLQDIRRITPGYENDVPIFEVIFERDNRLHYYYMNLQDGEFIKRYSMKQS
ncbi:Uncharacterized protein YpmB [Alteribacillus persepolensis]|uniref:Uncharacterized protein YpmB n=1 Tax=Alteribacillus persepolensis TaxID=568899 RepID=A0A1G7ZCV4_9BACI|nr:hypothetical protein [Alteribacillus persepolensis]SDH06528.1 Uncharacterized protein YpmB [Alteribacillus persepolensis]